MRHRQAISVLGLGYMKTGRCRERIERDSFGPRILQGLLPLRNCIRGQTDRTHDVEEACIYRPISGDNPPTATTSMMSGGKAKGQGD